MLPVACASGKDGLGRAIALLPSQPVDPLDVGGMAPAAQQNVYPSVAGVHTRVGHLLDPSLQRRLVLREGLAQVGRGRHLQYSKALRWLYSRREAHAISELLASGATGLAPDEKLPAETG